MTSESSSPWSWPAGSALNFLSAGSKRSSAAQSSNLKYTRCSNRSKFVSEGELLFSVCSTLTQSSSLSARKRISARRVLIVAAASGNASRPLSSQDNAASTSPVRSAACAPANAVSTLASSSFKPLPSSLRLLCQSPRTRSRIPCTVELLAFARRRAFNLRPALTRRQGFSAPSKRNNSFTTA